MAAEKACAFIEKNLIKQDFIYVSYRNGVCSVRGFLDEYAYYTMALIFLYDVTGDTKYLKRAEKFCGEAERQFEDKQGGYFLYGAENERLITRHKETYDGAMPGGNSAMAYCLVRLSQLTEKEAYKEAAERQLIFLSGEAEHYPAGYSLFLTALLFYQNPPQKITVVMAEKDSREEIMAENNDSRMEEKDGRKGIRSENIDSRQKIISRLPLYADIKILQKEEGEYRLLNHRTTYYVCRNFTCLPPSNQEPI